MTNPLFLFSKEKTLKIGLFGLGKSNLGVLITLTVVTVIIFVCTVIWGVTRLSSMDDTPEEEINTNIPELNILFWK